MKCPLVKRGEERMRSARQNGATLPTETLSAPDGSAGGIAGLE